VLGVRGEWPTEWIVAERFVRVHRLRVDEVFKTAALTFSSIAFSPG
jgi:hypothetical protein